MSTIEPGAMRRRAQRKADVAERRKQRGDNLREWWAARSEAARKAHAEAHPIKPREAVYADTFIEGPFNSSRALRRASYANWPSRRGTLAAQRKNAASLRTHIAIRNADTGHLDRHSYTDIARYLDALNKA